ncbi:ABC1 domain-containing protein [Rhizoctonia solani AG-1 IA]|uniref:ABC1 domain-containing protein n=1 Tax=Thanatephorus cucumeris (strain AG1-IA) TaxID=983506 RepID=L8WKF5_THACA|nr:ABC1 domain-containing protein [Rhizoctonia solani AG-1 IA]
MANSLLQATHDVHSLNSLRHLHMLTLYPRHPLHPTSLKLHPRTELPHLNQKSNWFEHLENDHNEGTIAQSAGISHATYERSLASQDTMGSEISVNTMEPQNDGSAPDVREVVSHLVAHGCQDLSARLDESSFGEYPVAHGGFSDIYHGRLLDSTRVAVKALRVSVDSITKEPKHFKSVQPPQRHPIAWIGNLSESNWDAFPLDGAGQSASLPADSTGCRPASYGAALAGLNL